MRLCFVGYRETSQGCTIIVFGVDLFAFVWVTSCNILLGSFLMLGCTIIFR